MTCARSALDALFLMRPVLWVPVWGFAVFGAARGAAAQGSPAPLVSRGLFGVPQWGLLMLFSCAVGSVYVLNQLADIDADRANPGFALLAQGHVSVKLAGVTAAVAGVLPLLGAAVLRQPALLLLSAAALVLGALYCLPPVRLSGRPLFDFAANAAGYGFLAFGCGWWMSGAALTPQLMRDGLPYVLLMCGGSVSSTIPDIEGDRAGGKYTTAVALGPLWAHRLALACVAAGTAVAGALGDTAALICGLAAVPCYVVHELVRSRRTMEATYKIGGAAMMVVAALREPFLAVLGVAVFGATLAYFRLRFRVVYPSLMPAAHANRTP